jgi:uncharacterized protein with HEPN domain
MAAATIFHIIGGPILKETGSMDAQDADTKKESLISPESSERFERLYSEAQAVKMLNLKSIIQEKAAPGPDAISEDLKHSQMALKAIEIQLRILGEKLKNEKSEALPKEFREIWDVLTQVPMVKAVLSRNVIMEQIIKNLRERHRR